MPAPEPAPRPRPRRRPRRRGTARPRPRPAVRSRRQACLQQVGASGLAPPQAARDLPDAAAAKCCTPCPASSPSTWTWPRRRRSGASPRPPNRMPEELDAVLRRASAAGVALPAPSTDGVDSRPNPSGVGAGAISRYNDAGVHARPAATLGQLVVHGGLSSVTVASGRLPHHPRRRRGFPDRPSAAGDRPAGCTVGSARYLPWRGGSPVSCQGACRAAPAGRPACSPGPVCRTGREPGSGRSRPGR
jgi:hypothetical protein